MKYPSPMSRLRLQPMFNLAKRNARSPTQLALGFVRSRWFVASTIIGTSSLAQLQETLPAMLTPLADILAEIDAIHLRYTNPAP